MKLTIAVGALALTACGPAAAPAPEPLSCAPVVPVTAQHPMATRPAALAGTYQLIRVHSQPNGGVAVSGLLHLMPLDSSSRAAAVGGPVRDLTGWLDSAHGAREQEPVVLAGEHLRIGRTGEPGAQHLTITAVAPNGFWGWWQADRSGAVETDPSTGRVYPDPAGYFCALRRDTGR